MKTLGQLICGFDPTAGARKRLLRWLPGLALITAGLALASPALATTPVTTRATVSGTAPFATCPGFDVIVNYTSTLEDTLFFDSGGALVREQFHFHGTGELVNTVTGKTETGSSPSMLIYDYQARTLVQVGLVFHNNIPGQGIVALTAGRLVYAGFDEFGTPIGDPVFVAGPHGDIDWCAIMA